MTDRNKIIEFCQDYLKVNDFEDSCYNGLQVEGSEKVNKIITGVSLSKQLIEEAIKRKAEMIMVHHGIFNNQLAPPVHITDIIHGRLKLLLENDINLCGFHLPLDAHPVIGNNASLCKMLGVKNLKPFDVGFIGELSSRMEFKKFIEMVDKKLNTKSYVVAGGPRTIKRIGIIFGAASPDFKEAFAMGADTYITGDIRENIVREVEELGINFISAGHYNTEKMGIKNLGNLVSQKFKINVEFVDIACNV